MPQIKLSISLLLAFCLSASALFAQRTLSLPEAIAAKVVAISARGSGGFHGECLQLAVKNLTNDLIALEIPAGYLFPSQDTNLQDLMVTAPVALDLAPRKVKNTALYAMCTQSGNMSPSKGAVYGPGALAEPKLLNLARIIAENKYQNSTAQAAVWAVANRDPIRQIYGEDSSMVRDIATYVSEVTGTPLAEFILTPRRHQITDIRGSIEGFIPQHLSDATLGLYDPEGNLVRTYFSGRKVEKGFMQWKLGASHTLGDSTLLTLRLMEGEELVMEKSIQAGDSVFELQQVLSEAVLIYEAKQTIRADIGVYDDQDRLYFLLAENKAIPKGQHRSRYIAGKALPADQSYFIKIKVGEETIASEALDLNAPPPEIHAIRKVSGTARFTLSEEIQDAQLAIYDAQGRLKRILYDVNAMKPGKKTFTYSFQHDQGPEATFTLRLTNAEGTVVVEQEIRK